MMMSMKFKILNYLLGASSSETFQNISHPKEQVYNISAFTIFLFNISTYIK